MLLIDLAGNKRGAVPIQEALAEAEEAGLDLVEVAPNEVPPVCKIMDYGKMAYQAKKKRTHVKSGSELKEISFSMKISEHDIDTKLKKAREFVEKGHKLRFNLTLRGRERAYADTNGLNQLRRLVDKMRDICVVEQMSTQMLGNRLFAILSPSKAKPGAAKPAAAAGAKAQSTGTGHVVKPSGNGSGGIKVPDEVRAAVEQPAPAPEQAPAPPPAEQSASGTQPPANQ